MYCYYVTKRYLKKTKVDWRIKLLFLTLLNSKNKQVHAVPAMLNNNTYTWTKDSKNNTINYNIYIIKVYCYIVTKRYKAFHLDLGHLSNQPAISESFYMLIHDFSVVVPVIRLATSHWWRVSCINT